MTRLVAMAVMLGSCVYAQTEWEREMAAGNSALEPEKVKTAEQHFRAAVTAAANPAEKAAALTKLGLVLHSVRDPSQEYLAKTIETLYTEAIAIDSGATRDRALTLELYALLLDQTHRAQEAARLRASAAGIRESEFRANSLPGPPPGEVLKVSEAVTAPKLAHKIEPAYSPEARIIRHEGTPVLEVVVGVDGDVRQAKLVHSTGFGLDEQALAAVSQWKFKPATKDGNPVAVMAHVEVNFRLL